MKWAGVKILSKRLRCKVRFTELFLFLHRHAFVLNYLVVDRIFLIDSGKESNHEIIAIKLGLSNQLIQSLMLLKK